MYGGPYHVIAAYNITSMVLFRFGGGGGNLVCNSLCSQEVRNLNGPNVEVVSGLASMHTEPMYFTCTSILRHLLGSV